MYRREEIPTGYDVQQYVRRIAHQFRGQMDAAYLFGSRATVHFRAESDFDIVVTGEPLLFLELLDCMWAARDGIDLFVQMAPDLFAKPWVEPGSDGMRRKFLRGDIDQANMTFATDRGCGPIVTLWKRA